MLITSTFVIALILAPAFRDILAWAWDTVCGAARSIVLCEVQMRCNDDWQAMAAFLNKRAQPIWLKDSQYALGATFVRSLGRVANVPFLGKGQGLYLFRNRPLWFSTDSSWMCMYFIRGTFDPDQLVAEMFEHYFKQSDHGYKIVTVDGAEWLETKSTGTTPQASHSDDAVVGYGRSIAHSPDDLEDPTPREPMDAVALVEAQREALTEAKAWLRARTWYEERGISWRRGWSLIGDPGTGKTTFVRAVAQALDLPLFCLDLSGMNNHQLRNAWAKSAAEAPCVLLLEDLDGTFNGREPVGGTEVTFDCLLNLIQGVKANPGVLLVITTNHPDSLDPALMRPGRAGDRVINFGSLSDEGKQKIADRILAGTGLAGKIAAESPDETGAQFENRCVEAALAHFWSNK